MVIGRNQNSYFLTRGFRLLYNLILSLPGSPVLYYGDDIGMGENVMLADRGGLRTPMQWNDGLNAGFSSVDPTRLYAPIIDNPETSYQHINVEAQLREEHSLLSWLKKVIALRKNIPAFAHGTLKMLAPANPQMIAYLREWNDERVLLVSNLSGKEQSAELDLQQFSHAVPTDLLRNTPFPPITMRAYKLTIEPYGFLWLRVQ